MSGDKFDLRKRPLAGALIGALSLMTALPALADSEIEALKRELAEQRKLIQTLLEQQESQKKTVAKIEQQAAGSGSPGAPSAAPAVTVYGLLDGGIEHITNITSGANHGSLTRVPSITGTIPSRLGFRASKELAPGLKGIAVLEAGFNLDSGTLGQGGRIFGRQLFAGVETPYGNFTLGRQYSMLLHGMGDSDLLGPNIYALGSLDNYLPNARFDNSIAWFGKFSNWSFGATYSTGRDTVGSTPASGTCAGEIAGATSACKAWSAVAKYDTPSYGLAVAVDEASGGTGATASFFNGAAAIAMTRPEDTDRRTVVGGYLKFGAAKLGIGWLGREVDVAAGSVKSNAYYLEGAYQLNEKFSVDGGLNRITNKDQNRNATLYVLRGFYHLTKEFSPYLQLAHVRNSANAQYAASVGAGISPPAGGAQTASMAGFRYRF